MYKAIAANKRNTFLIMALFVAIVGGIGWALDYVYGGDGSTAIMIVVIATFYAMLQYFLASKLALSMAGARQIEKKDNPRLYRMVENLSITLGLPMPKVYIIDDPAPNAFATGRNPQTSAVAATTGLLEIMNDSELEAVLAHEMGHVQNYDIRISMIVFGLVSAIGLISDLAIRMMFFSGDRDRDGGNAVLMIVGLIAIVLAPIIALMVQLAVSRQREYLADASGCLTTRHPDALISALEKLKQNGKPMKKQNSAMAHLYFTNPLKASSFSKLFSTHPPLEDRINRLKKMATEF